MTDLSKDTPARKKRGFNWFILVPAAVFGLFIGFYVSLTMNRSDETRSTLIGQPAPEIVGGTLPGLPGFDMADLAQGQPVIVNFWASWCPPCRAEHPALVQLAAEGIPVYGVNKSDAEGDALAFLGELGNPYAGVLVDANGRQSLDWGVVALPETFVLNGEGEVVLAFKGPIHRVMDTIIRPALAEAAE